MITMNNNAFNYINLDYLELMSDGDDSMKKVMLEMLFEELPLEIGRMKQMCQESNWKDLSSVSHKMKSTLSFVGNSEMIEANKKIEILAKEMEEVKAIPPLLNILEELLPKAVGELRQVYDRL